MNELVKMKCRRCSKGKDAIVRTAQQQGATVELTPLDSPPVPSQEQCKREQYRAEEQEYYWLDRPDDYNVFEEQQVFLDNEGADY